MILLIKSNINIEFYRKKLKKYFKIFPSIEKLKKVNTKEKIYIMLMVEQIAVVIS